DRVLRHAELPVAPDDAGAWHGTLDAPHDRLGFYRVRVKLSNGLALPQLNTRPAGYLTYAVVPDPAQRPLYPPDETFFGMQGAFNANVNEPAYLGVRWLLGGYGWRDLEPKQAGEFAAQLARQREQHKPNVAWVAGGKPWQTYAIPTLFFAPAWAVTKDSAQYVSGVLTPDGETAWQEYCRNATRAFAAEHPELPRRYYQITWEPVYPWGYRGTDEELIRIYQLAYPAVHEGDPQGLVLGPTGAGINSGDVEWNLTLLRKGLGRWLDAFSIHPYHPNPPERSGLVEHVRQLKEVVRQYAGKPLELLGTEQGGATHEHEAEELDQARGLLRQNLIMLGEGFKLNLGFYGMDYPTEPGYGYCYNLNPKIAWGSDKIGPKPIAPGYAAQSFLLEGRKSAGAIEWLGETTLGYAYERGDDVTLALWDYGDAPREVTLPAGVAQVTVYDWMGNARTVACPGGDLKLTLGPEPAYVAGVAAKLWCSRAERPVTLAATRVTGYVGQSLVLTGTVGKGVARVGLEVGGVARGAAAPDPGKRTFRLAAPIGPSEQPGIRPFRVTATDARGKALGVAGGVLTIRPPVEVRSVSPVVKDGEWGVAVRLRSAGGGRQQGALEVRLAGVPQTRQGQPFEVSGANEKAVVLTWPDLQVPPQRVLDAVVSVTSAGGYRFDTRAKLNFLAASRRAEPKVDADPADWPAGGEMLLAGREAVVRTPADWTGNADGSATVRLAPCDGGLGLLAEVRDDHYLQAGVGFDTWKGDCLQVGYDLDPGKAAADTGNLLADVGNRHRAGEIDLALTREGPQAFRTVTFDKDKLPVRLLTPAELPVAVKADDGAAVYEAVIPWFTLGLDKPPATGDRLGFALTVNDMDEEKQFDPSAVGAFGGITPSKDPAKFGVVLLADAAPQVATGGTRLAYSGALGQSQRTDLKPLPFVAANGATEVAGWLWVIAGYELYCFDPQGVPSTAIRRSKLPAAATHLGVQTDGERLHWASWDHQLWSVAPGKGTAEPWGDLQLSDKVRSIAVARLDAPKAGYAAKARVLVLEGDEVRGYDANSQPLGVLLHLTRPEKAEWWYSAVGFEPSTGDILVGSYWPDSKVYRFAADGKEVTTEGWPRVGQAASFGVVGGRAWMIGQGGLAQALPLLAKEPVGDILGGPGTMYANGLAGGFLSTSQGLVGFGPRGRPSGVRLGGLGGVRALAVASDGTLVGLIENGQRTIVLGLDDDPWTPFRSNANEPWRMANGWTNKGCALAWNAPYYACLDETGKQLWDFDPHHTGFKETPWLKRSEPNSLTAPRAVAVGDTLTWVLDGGRLLECPGSEVAKGVERTLPGLADPAKLVALAATGDELLLAATATEVRAWRRAADGGYAAAWAAGPFQAVTGLAAAGGGVAAADGGAKVVALLALADGRPTARLTAADVPGGWTPGAITASGRWIVVADEAGKRLVRLRVDGM
ncbi:MAG: hypothetical protein HYU66_10790, partial [Armatimonadetes bacterium]|nr:hypothetical protein [Armatimonadota bacterium]